jgi:tetratricopeptide (TPR) repeat protein
MGKVHRLLRQPEQAATALEKALALFEQMPRGRLALAETYAELGRWAEVQRECEVFLRACPDDVGGLELCGQALLKLGRLAEAEAIYRRLVAEKPSGMAYFALAALADARGDRQDAAALCRMAWVLERTDARIPFLLGCCLLEAGEYREALAALIEAERLAPGTPEIAERLKLLGRLLGVGAHAAPGTSHLAPRTSCPVRRTPHPEPGTGRGPPP